MRAPASHDITTETSTLAADHRRSPARKLVAVDPRLLAEHKLAVIIYTVVFLILMIGLSSIDDILFIVYRFISGRTFEYKEFQLPTFDQNRIIYLIIFVLFQLGLLWGVGAVHIGRHARQRVATVISLAALASVATFLAIGALLLAVGKVPKTSGAVVSPIVAYTILGGMWLFWLILGLLYWRGRDSFATLHRLISLLLASSWIEFSVVLPAYLANRDKDRDCYWLSESSFAIGMVIPCCVLLFGPGLFLFYLRERQLARENLARAASILRRKAAVINPPEIKSDSYISNARTMSIIVISLGFLGFALGVFNEQRAASYSECRNLLLVNYLKKRFVDYTRLASAITAQGVATGKPGSVSVPNSPFGEIVITFVEQDSTAPGKVPLPPPPPPLAGGPEIAAPPEKPAFVAKVTEDGESWASNPFYLSEIDLGHLQKILYDLDIKEGPDDKNIMSALHRAVYQRPIKIPGLDFWDFNARSGVWIIALLATALLIAVRNALRRIPDDSAGGIAEPWLVLDAETASERAVAAAWKASIMLSGWLAAFGLILSLESDYLVRGRSWNVVGLGFDYLILVVILIANNRVSLELYTDLRRIGTIRDCHRQLAGQTRLDALGETQTEDAGC